jgi:ribosomal protein S18 acetylase RimI-like enzyme
MRITGYKHSEDLARMMEINDSCYSGIYCPPRNIMVDNLLVSDVFVARVDESFAASELLTYGDLGHIVGFAIVRDQEHVPAYIWNIAVDPAYQGRGVGGNLLREIIKKYTLAKSMGISLHVNVENAAQKLYFDYGFRVTSYVKDYFKPDDGLYMLRKLP